MSRVQAVLFDKYQWSAKRSAAWLSGHGYAPIKAAHETRSLRRYRILEPVPGAQYRTLKLGTGTGVSFVLMGA